VALIKDRQALPDIAKPTADLIERLGFKWELDYEYPLPDTAQRVQIRNEKHYEPPSQKAAYAAAMRRGDKFPPIVITKDGHLVDGSTRVGAARRNQWPNIQALILNVNYETATEKEQRRIMILGAGFNARNGKGIDRNEIAAAVKEVAGDGTWDATRVAALLGVTDATVQGIFAEQKARDRAAKLGIVLNGSVPASQVRLLGQRSPKFNDDPFAAVTSLTQDAGLDRTVLRELCDRMQAKGTDEEKLAVVAEERKSREGQIAEFKATGKKVPPASAELRRKLGYVLGFEDNPRGLVEHNKDIAVRHLDQLVKASKVLDSAITAQRALNTEMAA
jgi:hypothetical protein